MNKQIKGALLVTSAMVMFSLMSLLVKAVSPAVDAVQSVFARGLVGVVLVFSWARRRGVSVSGKNKGLLFLRALFGTIALVMVFFAFTKIPIANAMLLNQTTPVFMVPLAVIFLKERISLAHVALVLVAFIGVGLVLRPNADGFELYGVLALVSAFFAALAYLLVRYLSATEHPVTIVFWFVVVSTLGVAPFAFSHSPVWSVELVVQLLAMGFLGTVGQLLLTAGYRLGEAGRLVVIGSTGAFFCALWDWLFFHHLPDGVTLMGGLVVIGACAGIQLLQKPG